MLKLFIVYVGEILLTLTLITQVLIPLFVPNLKFFWFFRYKRLPDDDGDDGCKNS